MKKIYFVAFLFFPFSLFLTGCSKGSDTAAPTIERVRITAKDSTILGAGIGNTLAIIGTHLASTQQVLFNDYSVYINPSYIQDNVILVQLPKEVPYRGQSNMLKVKTLNGEASTAFSIIQPLATITSFAPSSGNPGDIITILGKDLDNVKFVKIGSDTVKVVAGGTDMKLQVIVPKNGATGKISVNTVAGESISSTPFGISFIIYDDVMASGWDAYEWDADRDMENKEHVKKGTSIKMVYTAAYGGFGAGIGTPVKTKGYVALKMSIFIPSTVAETKIKVGIKDAAGSTNQYGKILVLVPGWNEVTLDLMKDLNGPVSFTEFQIQEWGNPKLPTIYIDDLGLL